MQVNFEITDREESLNDFNIQKRMDTFRSLLSSIELHSKDRSESLRVFNLHCHSFFSYNGYGLSPTALVWKAKQNNFYAIGLVDFDVLDGVDEFLTACSLANIRGCAGFETRVFVPQFASMEINSPGEPGISYHIGMGFISQSVKKKDVLQSLKVIAQRRLQKMIQLVNSYLSPLTIDYETEVIPLTPSGNPTERHLCTALYLKSKKLFPDEKEWIHYWSSKLNMATDEIEKHTTDTVWIQNSIRAKLMKSGGPGYVKPEPELFPPLNVVNEFILANCAIPTFAWLDGTSSGEMQIEELLNIMTASGVRAVNIIPDRNWNIKDPELKRVKLENLRRFVQLAQERYLPIFIGTELNAPGQKFVDDLDAEELRPFYHVFLDGVHIAIAHTVLEKIAGMGYTSPWADSYFAHPRERYEFFKEIGERLSGKL